MYTFSISVNSSAGFSASRLGANIALPRSQVSRTISLLGMLWSLCIPRVAKSMKQIKSSQI